MKHEDEYWTISIRRTLQSFFRFLLRSSAFSHREIQELPLAVVQEIVYRIISISIPLFTLPTLFVAWSREQYLLFTILLSLSLVVLISAIRLLKSNVRIISPVTLLVLCAILYFAAVLLVQHQVMLWSYSFIALAPVAISTIEIPTRAGSDGPPVIEHSPLSAWINRS